MQTKKSLPSITVVSRWTDERRLQPGITNRKRKQKTEACAMNRQTPVMAMEMEMDSHGGLKVTIRQTE